MKLKKKKITLETQC